MKYYHSSIPTLKDWKEDCVQDLLANIKHELLDKILHRKAYIIVKHTMLKNVDLIEHDQIPYREYYSCLRKLDNNKTNS